MIPIALILSKASRFDLENNKLLSAKAGAYVRYKLLKGVDLHVATIDDIASIPKGVKHYIFCGEEAARIVIGENTFKGLHSERGTIRYSKDLGIEYIVTYAPQDAFDMRASYEGEEEDEEDSSEEDDKGDSTVTSRKNWRGWMTLDMQKFLRHIHGDICPTSTTKMLINPGIDYVITRLAEDSILFVDIETTISDKEMTVLGLGFYKEGYVDEVCVITIYNFDGALAISYPDLITLYRAISKRFNTTIPVVAHNSMFDFFVLAWKYHIPPPLVIEDTMLMHHRKYAELEKSLGHCISLYTNLPYHKDEGFFEPNNESQQRTFLLYNAKDVMSTMAVWKALRQDYTESMKQVNDSIRPYIINSLLGIAVDREELDRIISGSELAMKQYQRVCDTLVGTDVKYLPSSSQSCAKYFHDVLDYKVKKRSKETFKPSVDEGVLWKLKLEHPLNVVIDFSIKYREAQKINSIGGVTLWTTPIEQLLSNISEIININSQGILQKALNQSSESPLNYHSTSPAGSLVDTLLSCPKSLSHVIASLPSLTKLYSLKNKSSQTRQENSSLLLHNTSKQIRVIQPTGRMTTGWKLAGTTTFRLASSKLLGEVGTNLQNPNKQTLQCFKADRGYTLVQVDQAGAEALIVAYLCTPGRFRKLFQAGIKSHTYLACHLFTDDWIKYGLDTSWLADDVDFSKVKAHPLWNDVAKAIAKADIKYYMAKQTCHSANYKVGVRTFCLSMLKNSGGKVNLSVEEGKRLLDTYYRLFPEILSWHNEIDNKILTDRKLRNLQGYERTFFSIVEDDGREAYAFTPQSTVGTITNKAFAIMGRYIESQNLDWYLLNNKHDSILLQVPTDEVDKACSVLSYFIEAPLVGRDGVQFNMKSECSIGTDWGKYHEVDRPTGMRDYSEFRKTEFMLTLHKRMDKDGRSIKDDSVYSS